jgi:hypothetical protein
MFDTEGTFLGKWDICNCWGITIKKDGGRDGIMFMTDHANEQVMKVDMRNGKELARWGSLGQGPGQFDWAHDIAVDSKGAVYVSDTYGQKIQKFVDGKLVALIGTKQGDGTRWLPAAEPARVMPQLLRQPQELKRRPRRPATLNPCDEHIERWRTRRGLRNRGAD